MQHQRHAPRQLQRHAGGQLLERDLPRLPQRLALEDGLLVLTRIQPDAPLRTGGDEEGLAAREGIRELSAQRATGMDEVRRIPREGNLLAQSQRLQEEPLAHAVGHGVRDDAARE